MAQKLTFTPTGVCSRMIEIEVEDGVVKHVEFTGGCSGNTQAWPAGGRHGSGRSHQAPFRHPLRL